jgi:hypothetical protein
VGAARIFALVSSVLGAGAGCGALLGLDGASTVAESDAAPGAEAASGDGGEGGGAEDALPPGDDGASDADASASDHPSDATPGVILCGVGVVCSGAASVCCVHDTDRTCTPDNPADARAACGDVPVACVDPSDCTGSGPQPFCCAKIEGASTLTQCSATACTGDFSKIVCRSDTTCAGGHCSTRVGSGLPEVWICGP